MQETVSPVPKKPNIFLALIKCLTERSLTPLVEFFEQERETMKYLLKNAKGIILVLVFAAFGFGYFLNFRAVEVLREKAEEKKKFFNLRYEEVLNSDVKRANQKEMQFWAGRAFSNGEYAYCLRFVKAASDLNENDEWKAQIWIYGEASKLALNPTSEGYSIFTNNINSFVFEVEKNYKSNPIFHDQIGAVVSRLAQVEELLPDEGKKYMHSLVSQLLEFKRTADKNF
jgi:hypothetical protein